MKQLLGHPLQRFQLQLCQCRHRSIQLFHSGLRPSWYWKFLSWRTAQRDTVFLGDPGSSLIDEHAARRQISWGQPEIPKGGTCWVSWQDGGRKGFLLINSSHSFGSAQTYALVNLYPQISDGIILTGFSLNGSFVGYFGAGASFVQANLNQPFRFGNVSLASARSFLSQYGLEDAVNGLEPIQSLNYPAGYLTNANINSQQYLFFLPGYFDQDIVELGEATKQPTTPGELLTLGSIPAINEFKGPVLVITGSEILKPSLAFLNTDTFPRWRSPVLRRQLPCNRQSFTSINYEQYVEELSQSRNWRFCRLCTAKYGTRPQFPLQFFWSIQSNQHFFGCERIEVKLSKQG